MRKPAARVVAFSLAFAVNLCLAALVFHGHASPWLAAPWVLSLVLFALASYDRPPGRLQSLRPSAVVLLLLVAAFPVAVRAASLDSNRMHPDEFMTGYFSATHDFARSSFFGYMPEKWEWQGQFPKPFFFLQRAFFTVFGTSALTVRLSVQIHVAVVSVMLFLIVREILGRTCALIAVFLYSFLAMSVYLETLGLFFIGATSVFMTFCYFALRQYRTGGIFYAAMSGIACGFCYLMYYSSYIAFPLLVALSVVQWLRVRKVLVLENFVITLGGTLLVLAPFLAFSLRSGGYALRRASDLSILTGGWSPHREAVANGASPIPILRDNLVLDLKSFFRNGIAGSGGFEFGHLAFLDRFSLLLLVAGLLAGMVLLFKKSELFLVFLALAGSLAMVVLAIPPPTVHRFSLAFPFLAFVMTLPFYLLLHIPKLPASARYALAGGLLFLFACANERHLAEAVFRDDPPDDVRLSGLLNQRFAGRHLYVAAYDAYAFQKIFYFLNEWPDRQVETGFHDNQLKKFNRKEKYVYVMILADAFREKFEKADPNGRFYYFSRTYSLFAN